MRLTIEGADRPAVTVDATPIRVSCEPFGRLWKCCISFLTDDDLALVRFAGVTSYFTSSGQKPPLKTTGKHCSVCGSEQYTTPAGLTCKNGHGGAPAKEE